MLIGLDLSSPIFGAEYEVSPPQSTLAGGDVASAAYLCWKKGRCNQPMSWHLSQTKNDKIFYQKLSNATGLKEHLPTPHFSFSLFLSVFLPQLVPSAKLPENKAGLVRVMNGAGLTCPYFAWKLYLFWAPAEPWFSLAG